jgi:hypothetical protein
MSCAEAILKTAPKNKVSFLPERHSRMLLAEIHKKSQDARLRGHDARVADTH